MVQLYDSEEQYRASIADDAARQREADMRAARRWNRSQYLDFLEAYIACAIWSSTDETGEPITATRDDVSPDAYAAMDTDCLDFVKANVSDLFDLGPSQCGHDFWLTRNGHGAGFWDRGYGAVGDRLTDAAHVWGEADLYVGDDGYVHHQG
jgi:hypothetical protein